MAFRALKVAYSFKTWSASRAQGAVVATGLIAEAYFLIIAWVVWGFC